MCCLGVTSILNKQKRSLQLQNLLMARFVINISYLILKEFARGVIGCIYGNINSAVGLGLVKLMV